MMFYINMYPSRVVSEIFNVVKYRDIQIPVKGQSRLLNVVPFNDRKGIRPVKNGCWFVGGADLTGALHDE